MEWTTDDTEGEDILAMFDHIPQYIFIGTNNYSSGTLQQTCPVRHYQMNQAFDKVMRG